MKKLLQLSFLLTFFVFQMHGQKWISVENSSLKLSDSTKPAIPERYESYELNFDNFISKIENAPKRFESSEEGILIDWPMPGNQLQKFKLKRSDVFHPDLAAKYPQIKAYTGYSETDPTAILKISVSHKGLEGMLLSDQHETIYLDRQTARSKNQYILFKRSDYKRSLLPGEGTCTVEVPDDGYEEVEYHAKFGDCQLRKYRLAIACTGEYATFHGGNIPDVLAEYNASMVRVNGIYERDLTITMEIIPETDQVIFLNGATDPYSNNNGGAMLGQNQTTLDQIIGTENYDIGHVYSTGGGGIASLRSPCTNGKARGVTGLSNPTGDVFWVDYVAHEIGHQFGGRHTFNNSCGGNRTNATAIEPGSGSTIMAYAGICGPNVQGNSDDYFHSISQGEIANFVVAGAGGCAEIIPLDNNPPEIISMPPAGLTLPGATPFMLTAEATDADGDMLTYCWEQIDNEIADMPPEETATSGPAFRSEEPSVSPTRMFPTLLPVLFGLTKTTWEVVPNADRVMDFNLTVRDNNPLGGCTVDEEIRLNFTSSAGPFKITSPNTSMTWNSGDIETIQWDVANTDIAPVSCESVDILFSTDRGETFDIVLAENVPNNGEIDIVVPFQFTPQGRIMIKCSSSVFFDINDRDLSVVAPFSTDISPSEISVCPGDTATFNIEYTVFDSDPTPVTFSVNGLPPGATHTFTPEGADADTEVELVISNLSGTEAGIYDLEVIATGEILTQTQNVTLTIAPNENSAVSTLTPMDNEYGIPKTATFTWESQSGIVNYEVEVSKNPDFVDLVYSGVVSGNSVALNNLETYTVYYWRIRGVSPCIDAEWFDTKSFQTIGYDCATEMSTASIEIPQINAGTVTGEINVEEVGVLGDIMVSINIAHSYIGDLSGSITAPNGEEVALFDQPGVPESDFGCEHNNIVATFSTNAMMTSEDFENSCNSNGNAIEGEFQPLEPFETLNSSSRNGTWTLSITDPVDDDGGEITDWSITTCEPIPIDAGVVLTNNILQLENMLEGFITPILLEIETSDPAKTMFTLRSTPQSGMIQKWNEVSGQFESLSVGGIFSQEDINMDRVQYLLTDVNADEDSFLFDTEDDQSRYTANNTFLINSNIAPLSISVVAEHISCFGETDGRIFVTGTGGVPGYTYSINDGPFEEVSVFEGLAEGGYTLKVRDSAGSEVTSLEMMIIEPDQITFTHFLGFNEITIGAEGGTGDYMYSLDGINYTTENTISIADGETYKIFVKDENGCIAESSTELIYYQIGGAVIDVSDVPCKGDATGSISISSVSGGLAPYMYQLNDDAPTVQNVFNDLLAGSYDIKITGSGGSSYSELEVVVGEPVEALTINSFVEENTITLMGSGGTPGYVYNLNGLAYSSDNVFPNLADGEYEGCIQDSNGCEVCEMSIVVNTSVIESTLEELKLYPNPTRENFILSSETSINFNYEIIDMAGKRIRNSQGFSNNPISVEYLPPGLFLVKVNYKDDYKIFKLSKI